MPTEPIDGFAHAPSVFVELFFGIGDASPPLLDHLIFLTTAERFHSLTRIPNLLALPLYGRLKFLESLGKGQILKEIEDGETLKRRYGFVDVRE